MRLDWLAHDLRAAGLSVIEVPGWLTRSQLPERYYKPEGVANHHTAPPVPYPVNALLKSCNLNVKTDGTVYVISAGYQYDTGRGSSVVLNEVKRDTAPPGTAAARGLRDDYNANPYFVDVECDHPGDGSPIPAAQYDALICCNAVICQSMGWTANRVIGHLESTRRKIDPYWNDTRYSMPQIRTDTATQMGQPLEEAYMYPIRRGDGSPEQRPERNEDVQYIQAKLAALGHDVPDGGVADQNTLDAYFEVVGSPLGGSYIAGTEAAQFDVEWSKVFESGSPDLKAYAKKTWVKNQGYVPFGDVTIGKVT